MIKFKSLKTILLASALSIGISFFSTNNVFAATYKIQPGDSLYKIGVLFNTSSTILMNDNGLKSTNIYPGQALYVSCETHKVQSGESLYLIAKKYGVSINNLRKSNNIWNNYIYPGQTLNIPGVKPPSGVINYSQSDVDLLARLITAEAEGEPYAGKVAVGAVVINRVQSGSFPNSISSVIYQRINGYYQFTPVLNGHIYKPATADSVKAAYEALNGQDPTNGALFFYDSTVTNQWLLSKPVAVSIENLTFAY